MEQSGNADIRIEFGVVLIFLGIEDLLSQPDEFVELEEGKD